MKLKYLIKMGLDKKIKSKWFKVVNLILFFVIAFIINIDSVITFFGGDFDDKTTISVVDNTGYSYDLLKENITSVSSSINESTNNSYEYEVIKEDKSIEELKENIKNNIIIEVNNDSENYVSFKLITKGYINTVDYQIITSALTSSKVNIALNNSNIDMNELNNVYREPVIEREYIEDNKNTEEESAAVIMKTVFPIFILPFFMLTIFIVQMVGAEINDEKTTKGMEIIISSVSPKQHFFSKIISSNIFVILQSLLLVIYALVGLLIRSQITGDNITGVVNNLLGSVLTSDFISRLVYILPLTLILMLITFIGYSLVAGILSSITTSPEDFQQIQTPIMIILMVGYMLAIMASQFEGSIFIKVMGYVPFVSAILSPSLLVLGEFSIINVVISGIIMIFTDFLLIKYGLRIYKVGILNYSSKDLWKKIFKAVKNK